MRPKTKPAVSPVLPKSTEKSEFKVTAPVQKSKRAGAKNSSRTAAFSILVLQHPQEKSEALGSTDLFLEELPKSEPDILVGKCVGLSWPNLSKALAKAGLPDPGHTQRKWLVLFLGTGIRGEVCERKAGESAMIFVDKKGFMTEAATLHEGDETLLSLFQGIVLLDGTWAQAKTMWWRNSWLLKMQRAVLLPKGPSIYGKARREPRPECLSTLEAAAQAISILTGRSRLEKNLETAFRSFLDVQIGLKKMFPKAEMKTLVHEEPASKQDS